ncbi:Putative membrane protein [Escherichia coli ISC41]|nr:Putative membrane protein [Escherichia coli ISC41]
MTFTNINRVSELLSVPTKDASRDSFPGDHGMMLLIFSAFMWRLFRQSCWPYRPYYFCGFCVSQSNDWRTLVY